MPRTSAPSISEPLTSVLRARRIVPAPVAPSPEDIRARAYELYLARGAQPGREAEDWAQAEAELLGQVLAR